MFGNKLINKNFSFLMNERIVLKDKNRIIDEIFTIHEDIRLMKYSDCSFKLGRMAESLIREYLSDHDSSYDGKKLKNLWDIITYLKNAYSNNFEEEMFDSMHSLRKLRNANSHDYNSEGAEFLDILICLRALRRIIIFFFANNDKNGIEEFDESIYYLNNSFETRKINDMIKPTEKYLSSDISLQKIKLKEWMTLKETTISIPIYQRGYSWTEEQAEVLFYDIENRLNDGSTHYFGIIAGKSTKDINSKTKIKIIDGQQRLTTSFLFFCAARDIMIEKFQININDEYFLSNIFKLNSKEKIESFFDNPGGDIRKNEVFRGILKGNIANIKIDNEYWKNYNKFKELISNSKNCNPVWIRELINTFLSKFELANISFNDDNISQKKEMEIFENLNSKGKELTIEELIKNFIFNLCSEELLESDKNTNEIPRDYNFYIPDELKKNQSDKKENIENFYLILTQYGKGLEVPKNRLIQLAWLKEVIGKLFNFSNEFQTIAEYKNMLLKIHEFAKIFYDITIKKGEQIGKWLGVNEILKLCAKKDKLNLFVGLAFIIYEFLKRKKIYDINIELSQTIKNDIYEFFNILMKGMTKNSIVDNKGDSSLKRITLKSIYIVRKEFVNNKNITINEMSKKLKIEMSKDLNSDREFKTSLLNNRKNNRAIKWLFTLTDWEMQKSINNSCDLKYNDKSYIEYIFPKNSDLWKNEIMINDDKYDDFKFQNNKDKYLENIGNYFLGQDLKLGRKSDLLFLEKKKIHAANNSHLYNNPNDLEIDISKKITWSFEDIEKRTEKLVNYICTNVIKDDN